MASCLFLYGTLLSGLEPPRMAGPVGRLRFVGRGFVRGCLYDLGKYPGVVLRRGGAKVWGRVFELPEDPAVLRRLDAFEEFYPANPACSEFMRKECAVFFAAGKKISAWVYEYNRPPRTAQRIVEGDFVKSRKVSMASEKFFRLLDG